MKISRDGWLPQLEPEGIAEPVLVRLGGAKRIIQQSSFPMQAVTMVNASISAWATSSTLRDFFWNDVRIFALLVAFGLIAWMAMYFTVILPGEQAWGQGQSQRTERSPLKQDTEEILSRLEKLETEQDDERVATDGGEQLTPSVTLQNVQAACPYCDVPGVPGEHKGSAVLECPECDHIMFRRMNP